MAMVEAYVALQHHLEALTAQMAGRQMAQVGTQLMQVWHQELSGLQGEGLTPENYSQWRSLHTEVHRELRLLNVDLMFLGNSRSATTQAAKKVAVGDRLAKLQRYCERIQAIIAADDQHRPEA